MTDPSPDRPRHDHAETFDELVRRVDPDRWLASRFIADPAARADVAVLYALNDELARIAPAVTNPLMGEIRLAWWREAVDEIVLGRPVRRHPVAEALADVMRRRALDPALLYAMIDGRAADLDEGPFTDEAALYAYIDATAGALMALVAQGLGAEAPAPAVRSAARAWAVAGLARAHWRGAMRNRLPPDWTAADVRAAVDKALHASAADLKALPVPAFPAAAYAALAAPYAHKRDPTDLEKRLRLVWATARGRV